MPRGYYKRNEYHKKRMSEGAKNRKITPLFRKARSDNAKINPNYGMKGKHHSEKSKRLIGLKGKGRVAWNKDKKLSNNHKKKLSEAHIGINLGEKHPNWKGGITPINIKIRQSKEYKDWRIKVFERDNYTCQNCGSRGVILHADHIKPFAYFPELRLVIENGRTLCVPCHSKTDTYKGRIKNKYRFVN